MKRYKLFLALVVVALSFASCKDKEKEEETDDYMAFIGVWGVQQIDYYNIDYWGNPIENTRETFYFTPGDPDNGIDLVFRNDRSGEMRDRSRDTLYINDSTTIICPDTTLVTRFTYSYHTDDSKLYMNMQVAHPYTFQMDIVSLNKNSFTYINEYDNDYVEEALLIRLSFDAKGARNNNSLKSAIRPRRKGSLLSDY